MRHVLKAFFNKGHRGSFPDFQYVSSTPAVFQERTLAGVGEDEDDLHDDDEDNGPLPDDLQSAPFPFVTSASSGPAPVIYSVQQSKVRVYKPESTTSTTTTTTARPSTTTSTTTTSTTVRPYEYQLPPSSEPPQPRPPVQPQVQSHQPQQRPLVFSKRRPGPGEGRVSKPFEYLSRLSNFLSDRVFTGDTRRRQGAPDTRRRPALVRHRTQPGS